MLIKEYRIPLPLSVDEYRIAQLYMISKKSRTESEGQGSGVEIIKNEPYTDDSTGTSGQYTIKQYYVSSHLPNWIKSLFDSTVLSIKEEAWNAYPYTKTIYTCSFFNKFLIEIETRYFDEPGLQENVFNLSPNELKNVTVDYIDIVKDQISSNDYLKEEDPLIYHSVKTNRGPLSKNWLQEYTDEYKASCKLNEKPKKPIMCAYKLCKVQFNIWAIRQRIEKFIHDTAFRKIMVRAHRQAWAWQDEWYGLTMDDIRELERETQRQLAMKMNKGKLSEDENTSGKEINLPKEKSKVMGKKKNSEQDFNMLNWRMEKIENDSDSNDEYYDAKETIDANSLCKWSSMDCINKSQENYLENSSLYLELSKNSHFDSLNSKNSLDLKKNENCPYSILVFVLHGGHILETGTEINNKYSDFSMIKSTLDQISRTRYFQLTGRLSYRLICCPQICKNSLKFLSHLSTSFEESKKKFQCENIPIDCLPIFAVNSKDYKLQINKTINAINQSYSEFIETEEGKNFEGKIIFICDSLSGILAYDSLCKTEDLNQSTYDLEECDEKSKFNFLTDEVFLLGCPLSLILAYRSLNDSKSVKKPGSTQIYNLYHKMDHLVMRIEPLIEPNFNKICPIKIPKFNKKFFIEDEISIAEHLKMNEKILCKGIEDNLSLSSSLTDCFEEETSSSTSKLQKIVLNWWGKNRIDYEIYCPQGINNFPNHALPVLFHSGFWESNDVASFILDKLMNLVDPKHYCRAQKSEDKLIDTSKEKWLKKSTSLKIKNINSNHRANDIIVKEGQSQVLTARFVYGPLDMVSLRGEKVDIYLMKDMNQDEWIFIDSAVTDKSGYLNYTLNEKLECGLYPVKIIVRGDHSSIDFFLTVLPPQTECVVFSIDGSFTASVSVSGRDPKVRPGAVDVVRYWQNLGYLIIYITGRPGMQQQRVLAWLSEHNFPHGLIYFTGSLTTDPLKHKADYLKKLQENVEISLHAAYGSAKDIWIYQTLGLSRDNIYIIGKVSRKQMNLANVIIDGYSSHLEDLKSSRNSRQARKNSKLILPKGNFGLCGNFGGFCGIRLRRSHKIKAQKNFSYSSSNVPSVSSTPKFKKLSSANSSHYYTLNDKTYSFQNSFISNLFHSRTLSNKYK